MTLDKWMEEIPGKERSWSPQDSEKETERREFHERLLRAVSSLPERERDAICLRILKDKPPGEVAEIMGTKKATVRSSISRGIRRLRQAMKGPER